MQYWTTSVRLPSELRDRFENVRAWINSRPGTYAEVSKNELITFAVQRLITDLENQRTTSLTAEVAAVSGSPYRPEPVPVGDHR